MRARPDRGAPALARTVLAAASAMLVTGVWATSVPPAVALPSAGIVEPARHQGHVPLLRRVDLGALRPSAAPSQRPEAAPPPLRVAPATAGVQPWRRRSPPLLAQAPSVGSPTPLAAATGAVLEQLGAFPAATFATDPAPTSPPDTQVAVGPTYVAEAVNSELAIWTRGGSPVRSVNLNDLFTVPSGYSFTDPRIVYDTLSGRWLLSGLAYRVVSGSSSSEAYVAVSSSSDPTGSWDVYQLASGPGITDQPKVGTSSYLVVVSWNQFDASDVFTGDVTVVLQKSDLLSGAGVTETTFGPDATRAGVVPAISQSTTSTEYLAYNDSCGSGSSTTGMCTKGSSTVGVVAITGTPAAGDVAWNETYPSIAATASPPPAEQPTGPSIQTDDDRLLSATWQGGALWVADNDACTPSGDSTVRPCLRLIELSTVGAPSVQLDGDLGTVAEDLYYPAVAVDASGDPYVVATVSSATVAPSVAVFGQSAASGGFVRATLWRGAGGYDCSFCGTGTNRWGDYSGAAVDPQDPGTVWVAGEHTSSQGGDDWATAVGALTFSAPSVSGVGPSAGPTRGGTAVTVSGTGFTTGAAVSFGGVAATSVSVSSATSITATSPPGAPGPVDVTVTTPDGTSTTSAADRFTYTAPPAVTSISPSQGPVAGGTGVTITGTSLSGTSSVSFGGVAATSVSVSSATSITATSPPGPAGPVDVTVTTPYGTSTTSAADRFTYVAPPQPPPTQHGYWLVGGDGGIFTFGSAQFYGSTGNLVLQRPVVGITPTADRQGYWLVASDGGIFTFGDAGFYGSVPGLGIAPAGTGGSVRQLAAPIVGMVPSADGRGYFMVASDGGIFAFGDARFAGSCPAIGGCGGVAVAVAPDATGNGYWLATASGGVFTFGDAPFFGAPGPQAVPVTSAVRTVDGGGYLILFANGAVAAYGDAPSLGGPIGSVGGADPATAVFVTADGGGYWVADAGGAVFAYGDAPFDGSMAGRPLNAPVIAADGW